jgi:glycosyltransferase involved in cell wall biosynthesis
MPSSKTPDISIIIPTYNRANYIHSAIQSVLSQDSGNSYSCEVIVVDDGSTDCTEEVVARFGNRVTYIKTEHSGLPSIPRNIGIRAASGTYIAFQDSDDLWSPDKLSKQMPLFDDKTVIMTYGNAQPFHDNDKLRHNSNHIVSPDTLHKGESFNLLLEQNVISTLTVIMRKTVLDEVGLFNESVNAAGVEDYELWLRVSAKYPKGIKCLEQDVAKYRIHDNNVSTTDTKTALMRILRAFESTWMVDCLSKDQRRRLEDQTLRFRIDLNRLDAETEDQSIPTISVVMSIYNGERYLRPAIDSILSQTFRDFELILIDDGSKDSTVKIIREYNDPRIVLIQQTNHGLVYSLNKGISIARGKYIARHDADDISLPSRFEKELQLLMSDPEIGVVGSFFTYLNEKTRDTSLTITSPTKDVDIKRSMYTCNPFGHGTTMIRKAVFSTVDPYTDAYGPTEDFELWRRVAKHWKFGVVPEILYIYRLNSASISHTNGDIQHTNSNNLIREQWKQPFIHKTRRQIITDAEYYKSLESPFASQIFQQYMSQQKSITKELLARGWIRVGIGNARAIIFLDPSAKQQLMALIIKSILKKFKSKLR